MSLDSASVETTPISPDAQEAQLHRLAVRWRSVLRALFIGLAVLLWVAFIEDASHEHRLTVGAIAGRDANLATAVEHYVVRVLGTARAVHRLLAQQLLAGDAEAEIDAMLADRLRANDVFFELGMCMADGRVLTHSRSAAQLSPATCTGILSAAGTAADLAILPPIHGADGLLVPLAWPIADAQGMRLAVAVALSPADSMLRVMQSVVLRDDTAVLVVGADGVPRAAWRSRTGNVSDAAGFAALSALARDDGQALLDGRTYLVSTRDVPPAGLQVKVATASDDALAGFHARRARLLALCLLVSIGLAGVYRMLSRMHAEGVTRSRALFRARGELQEVNARLDQQVQERTAQLEQAYRDLETFSYAVAHDVRAPLASIAGFAQALQAGMASQATEKQQHYLRRIQSNAAHMDELTLHLLELGRITRAPLERAEVDLSALAVEVLEGLRESEPARNVVTEIEQGLSTHGDRALLRQVLENLLGNAWKFSSKQTEAHIALRSDPAAAAPGESVFVVEDDGQGFDSDQAPGLFQPFRRMHDREEFPGTGVGLATVQRIVALHGGRVWAQSRRGEGARFYLALPGAPRVRPPDPIS
jgi:signal transduction histidine kinase